MTEAQNKRAEQLANEDIDSIQATPSEKALFVAGYEAAVKDAQVLVDALEANKYTDECGYDREEVFEALEIWRGYE